MLFYSVLFLETSRQTKKMVQNVEKNMETEKYFRNLLVTFSNHSGIKQPDLFNSENLYSIYSPKKFKLVPRQDIVLNLKFNMTALKELET